MPATPEAAAFERVLGFDYGERRIGVATGQRITGTATPLKVVGNGPQGPDWAALDAMLREWRPQALVVGLPLTMEGEVQAITRRARAFGEQLRARYALPVLEQDERMSSIEANRRFVDARRAGAARQKDAQALDSLAAVVIVENWLARPA